MIKKLALLLSFCLFAVSSFGSVTYFGNHVDSAGSIVGTPGDVYANGGVTVRTTTGYAATCPGSGPQDVTEVSFYGHHTFSIGAGTPHVRIAIYSTSLVLMGYGANLAIPNNGSDQWQVQTSYTTITQLTGGSNYIIAITYDDNDIHSAYFNVSDGNKKYRLTNYNTSSWPAPWVTDDGDSTQEVVIRIGTQPAGSGPTNHSKFFFSGN